MIICHLNAYNELQLALILTGHAMYLDGVQPLCPKMEGKTDLKMIRAKSCDPEKAE